MEKYLNKVYFQEIFVTMQEWFLHNVLVLDNLIQIVVLVITFLLSRSISPSLRARHRQWVIERGKILLPGTLRNAFNVLILPGVWLIILWFCIVIADAVDWQRAILNIAESLLGVWVVIRFTATLIRNPFLTKTIAITAWTIAALNILNLLEPTLNIMDGAVLHIGQLNISILTLIKSFILLAAFLWAAGLISRVIEERLRRSTSLTPSMAVLTGKLIRIVLLTAAFFMAISSVGIDLTVFAVFGGAFGVGLGFGLQKVVSNFVSGIILLLDRSIKPGDVISIGDTYGWVKSLNARYVSLDTRYGVEYLIPNEDLIVQPVENWSYSHE